MAEYRKRRLRVNPQAYSVIEGNTVRKELETAPQQEEKKRKKVSTGVRKNRERALGMNRPTVMMLAMATVITVILCFEALLMQSRIISIKREVSRKQAELDSLRMSNDALQDSMTIYTDLDYVYKTATRKLGMVYPTEDQIIRFERTESEYVRQYEDIPGQE